MTVIKTNEPQSNYLQLAVLAVCVCACVHVCALVYVCVCGMQVFFCQCQLPSSHVSMRYEIIRTKLNSVAMSSSSSSSS